MERFLDEARILAKLQNTSNIVSVQNYFKENNTAYFVMEYIDGMSLKQYLANNGDKIPYEQALAILLPIMQALTQVHALNLLHRDISPDNIYITSKGESRLLDFGAARFSMGDGKSVSVILKHGYAPEEQYSSHGNQGPWTDVYAMGATLYRCITGILPPDSIERIHGDTVQTPSALGVRISPQVENALMKAIAIRTEDRFANMEGFIEALCGGRVPVKEPGTVGIQQKAPINHYGPETTQTGKEAGAWTRLCTRLRQNAAARWLAICGGVLILLLCVALPISLSTSGGGSTIANGGGGEQIPVLQSSDPLPTENDIQNTDPVETVPAATEWIEQSISDLNATISVPSDYVSDGAFTYTNEEKGCIINLDFVWNYDFMIPIYSIADVADNQEYIISSYMESLGDVADYQIIDVGDNQLSGRESYQIYVEMTMNDGTEKELAMAAMIGDNPFGCYFLVGINPLGDSTLRSEVYTILESFQCLGEISTYGTEYYASSEGYVQFLYNDTDIPMTITETTLTLPEGTVVPYIALTPEEDSSLGCIEVQVTWDYAMTGEEAAEYMCNIWSAGGAILGETSTETIGSVDWFIQELDYNSMTGFYAVADINGVPFMVTCSDSTEDGSLLESLMEVTAGIMMTVRPYAAN